jgi:hypothetical protein
MIDPTTYDSNDLLLMIDGVLHEPKPLDPVVAKAISAAITARSVAATNVNDALNAVPYKPGDFAYWVNAHRKASAQLAALGIDVVTYEEFKQ